MTLNKSCCPLPCEVKIIRKTILNVDYDTIHYAKMMDITELITRVCRKRDGKDSITVKKKLCNNVFIVFNNLCKYSHADGTIFGVSNRRAVIRLVNQRKFFGISTRCARLEICIIT